MRNDNFIDFARETAGVLQGSRDAFGYLDARDSAGIIILHLIDLLMVSDEKLSDLERKLKDERQ